MRWAPGILAVLVYAPTVLAQEVCEQEGLFDDPPTTVFRHDVGTVLEGRRAIDFSAAAEADTLQIRAVVSWD